MTQIKPFSGPNYHTNSDRPGNGQPCVLCGKHVKNPRKFARVTEGGARFAQVGETEADLSDDMGWYAVGSECVKTLKGADVQFQID